MRRLLFLIALAAALGVAFLVVDRTQPSWYLRLRYPLDYAACVRRILDDPLLAQQLSAGAVALASTYTWSTTAARLRRIYSDVLGRSLVRCDG